MYRALPRCTEPWPFIPLLLPLSKTAKRAKKANKGVIFGKRDNILNRDIYRKKQTNSL
jgi:hypothetical protein